MPKPRAVFRLILPATAPTRPPVRATADAVQTDLPSQTARLFAAKAD